MNPFYLLLKTICFTLLLALASVASFAQPCTPQGDENAYGTNNVWMAYVYQGTNFNTYKGYATEGSVASPNFDESFGGDQTNYATNGCSVYTEEFSVRYKLTKTFADGNYLFTVGADDGYRLSLDGGATWVIQNWGDHGYTTSTYTGHLNGAVNMVLEFYENHGGNRISFNMIAQCVGDGDPTAYATGNFWNGYLYQGTNFDQYKGHITEGNGTSLTFNETFGTSNGNFSTSNCFVITENFSARFRTRVNFPAGSYMFTVGGDDGYRLSLDGGATWVIDRWFGQSYNTFSYTGNVSGTHDVVLEYYEGGGDNRLSFTYSALALLPVTIMDWSARVVNNNDVQLNWKVADAVNFDHFIVQKSNDAVNFRNIQSITSKAGSQVQSYSYTDLNVSGTKVYYRLAMVDKDASVRYSAVAAVALQQANQVKVYPTIVENKQLYIESAKKQNRVQIEVVDMSGRVLQMEQRTLSAGRQTLSLDGFKAGAVMGSYIVRITGEDGIIAKQPIIIR